MAASTAGAFLGSVLAWTSARHRQHVSASRWLIAPHVGQMASLHVDGRRMNIEIEKAVPDPENDREAQLEQVFERRIA